MVFHPVPGLSPSVFTVIMNVYQEQPHLLDPHLGINVVSVFLKFDSEWRLIHSFLKSTLSLILYQSG